MTSDPGEIWQQLTSTRDLHRPGSLAALRNRPKAGR